MNMVEIHKTKLNSSNNRATKEERGQKKSSNQAVETCEEIKIQ